jgi:hypothetical protein
MMSRRHISVLSQAQRGLLRGAALGVFLLSMTSCGGDDEGGDSNGNGGGSTSGEPSTSAGEGGASAGGSTTASTGAPSSTSGGGGAPPLAGFGEPCATHDDCDSGFCASDDVFPEMLCTEVCTESLECPSADWCCFDPNGIGSGACRPVAWGDC